MTNSDELQQRYADEAKHQNLKETSVETFSLQTARIKPTKPIKPVLDKNVPDGVKLETFAIYNNKR